MATNNDIPLVDLRRQVETLAPELLAAYEDLLAKTDFIGGAAVGVFETAFAQYCGAEYCVGVGNGTDALDLIFRALALPPGSEVIVPAMSFVATAETLSAQGLKAVFADVDPETYTLDPTQVEKLITPRTKALLPVHLYGQPADLSALSALVERHGLTLIEDAAQAHGAEYDGRRIGSIGRAAAFSFYPGKNLGAFGDAGAVTTSDPALATKIRMLANHGRTTKYEHEMEGVNSRLDTLQAAVLNIKLRHLDDWNARRRHWAALYTSLLSDMPQITSPTTGPSRNPVFHLYVIRTARRDELLAHLKAKGIAAGVHYPIPLHLQPAFAYLGHRVGDFPVAEQLANECLSLPLFPELTATEVRTVASTVRAFFA